MMRADLSLFCHSEFSVKLKKEKAEPMHWPIPECNRLAQCSYTALLCLVGPQFVFIFIPASAFALPGLYFIAYASLD